MSSEIYTHVLTRTMATAVCSNDPVPWRHIIENSDSLQMVLSLWSTGCTAREIATQLRVPKRYIESSIAALRTTRNEARREQLDAAIRARRSNFEATPWTPEMMAFLVECMERGLGNKEIAVLMNKTPKSIERKAYRLRRARVLASVKPPMKREAVVAANAEPDVTDGIRFIQRELELEDLRNSLVEATRREEELTLRRIEMVTDDNDVSQETVDNLDAQLLLAREKHRIITDALRVLEGETGDGSTAVTTDAAVADVIFNVKLACKRRRRIKKKKDV